MYNICIMFSDIQINVPDCIPDTICICIRSYSTYTYSMHEAHTCFISICVFPQNFGKIQAASPNQDLPDLVMTHSQRTGKSLFYSWENSRSLDWEMASMANCDKLPEGIFVWSLNEL